METDSKVDDSQMTISGTDISPGASQVPKAPEVPIGDNDNGKADFTLAVCSRVFSNAVIWRKLGTFLNFTDLKYLRLVSPVFNQNVIDETDFKSRAFINMKSYRLQDPDDIFQPTTVWKHFKIERFIPDPDTIDQGDDTCSSQDDNSGDISEGETGAHSFEDMCVEDNSIHKSGSNRNLLNIDFIYDLLKGAESLTIVSSCDFDKPLEVLPLVKELLEAPNHLSSLSLDVHTIEEHYEGIFKTLSDKLCTTFENLSEFHVLPASEKLGDLCDEVYDFANALAVLSTVMTKLKVFTLPKFICENNMDGIYSVLKIVEENKNHLTVFKSADSHFWSTVSSMMNSQSAAMTIPQMTILQQLKTLKIVATHVDTTNGKNPLENIIKSLKDQPRLERLELSIEPKFPSEICPFISSLTNLKILRLRTKGFDAQDSHSWSFLSTLSKLTEFKFVLEKSAGVAPNLSVDVNTIVASLPKSTRIIKIKGIRFGVHFTHKKSLCPIENLIQFHTRNITELNLSHCSYFVTDIVMECICRNFQMVRKLDVSENPLLTDYGFTGIRTGGTQLLLPLFSIKNIKGLRCLKINGCKITDATLLDAILFLELIHLDVFDCKAITEEGIVTVIQNNPSLEILKTDIAVSMEFLSDFPRIRPDVELDYWDEVYNSDGDFSDVGLHDDNDSEISEEFYDEEDDFIDDEEHSDHESIDDYDMADEADDFVNAEEAEDAIDPDSDNSPKFSSDSSSDSDDGDLDSKDHEEENGHGSGDFNNHGDFDYNVDVGVANVGVDFDLNDDGSDSDYSLMSEGSDVMEY